MAKKRQADYYWKWLIVGCSFFIQLYGLGIEVAKGVFMVEFLEYFEEGATVFSWIFMFEAIGGTVTGPAAGYAVSKYGARKVALFSAILHTAAIGLSVFAESVPHLIVTFGILNGIGLNVAHICGLSTIPRYFTDGYAFANGLAGMGSGCGTMVLPPLVVILIEHYGWHGAFIVLTGFSANLCVCAVSMKPPFKATTKTENVHLEEKNNREPSSQEDKDVCQEKSDQLSKDGVPAAIESASDTDRDNKTVALVEDSEEEPARPCLSKKCSIVSRLTGCFLFRKYPIYGIFIFSLLSYCVYIVSNSLWIVVRAVDLGIPRIDASALMTCVGACSMFSRLIHGWFIDRGYISPLLLLTLMMTASTISNIVLTFTTKYAVMMTSCAVLGLAQGTIVPLAIVSARNFVEPGDLPSALGLLVATLNLAGVTIPVAGKIYDVTEDARHPFFLTDAFLLISAILCLLVYKLQQRHVKSSSDLHAARQEETQ
ncbi:monocarboxylate transporter 12-like [Ptychodera flava]|uniref:monocarboxylate transporter 12-like n=1 Tax=Ptychodera flava TaxID=63121 RepID=UPI00396A2185